MVRAKVGGEVNLLDLGFCPLCKFPLGLVTRGQKWHITIHLRCTNYTTQCPYEDEFPFATMEEYKKHYQNEEEKK
jgi:uncharacterized protein YbaR (Trm112 family)